MHITQTRLLKRSDLKPAQSLFRRAYYLSRQWDKKVQSAIALYGERNSTHISGIYSDHFPQGTQDQLRAIAHLITKYLDRAWKAFPSRIRWRTKLLLKEAVIAKYGKGYYG